MASAIFRSTSRYQLHSAQDAYNFSSVRMWLSCLWKQLLLLVLYTTEVK